MKKQAVKYLSGDHHAAMIKSIELTLQDKSPIQIRCNHNRTDIKTYYVTINGNTDLIGNESMLSGIRKTIMHMLSDRRTNRIYNTFNKYFILYTESDGIKGENCYNNNIAVPFDYTTIRHFNIERA